MGTGHVAADELSVHGRFGDVSVGIGTRDGFDGHRFHRDRFDRNFGRKKFDRRSFEERFERRVLREKLFDRDEPVLFGSGPVNDFARDQKKRAVEEAKRRPLHGHRRFERDRFDRDLLLPFHHPFHGVFLDVDDDEVEEEDGQDQAARPAAPPEPVQPQVTEPEPPDVRGPRWEFARGADAGVPAGLQVGQPLPSGRPHVALDWEDYDLPRPPAGQSYARFQGAVVRIDTDSRVVREILWPPTG